MYVQTGDELISQVAVKDPQLLFSQRFLAAEGEEKIIYVKVKGNFLFSAIGRMVGREVERFFRQFQVPSLFYSLLFYKCIVQINSIITKNL